MYMCMYIIFVHVQCHVVLLTVTELMYDKAYKVEGPSIMMFNYLIYRGS